MNKMNPKVLFITIYTYIGVSVSSCLARCDYNVFFAFGLLLLMRNYYQKDAKYFGKIILHILAGLCLADIIWMIVFIPYWNTNNPTLAWNKVAGIRMYVIIVAFIDLGIKIAIGWFIFSDYKEKNNADMEYLWKFDYKNNNVQMRKANI